MRTVVLVTLKSQYSLMVRDQELCSKKAQFSLFWALFYMALICFLIGISTKGIIEHEISKFESIILHLY
jgi:hypothetical protein